eukprot:scpid110196/ scgid15395/ 
MNQRTSLRLWRVGLSSTGILSQLSTVALAAFRSWLHSIAHRSLDLKAARHCLVAIKAQSRSAGHSSLTSDTWTRNATSLFYHHYPLDKQQGCIQPCIYHTQG